MIVIKGFMLSLLLIGSCVKKVYNQDQILNNSTSETETDKSDDASCIVVLSNNTFTTISGENVSDLAESHTLNLINETISVIKPNTFVTLTKLKVLSLNNNTISELDALVFNGLKSVFRISLSHNNISYIHPEAFTGATSVHFLLLDYNSLTTIYNGTFNGLQQLHQLQLHHNSIKVICAGAFSNVSRTITILLHHNCINSRSVKNAFIGVTLFYNLALDSNYINVLTTGMFIGLQLSQALQLCNNSMSHISPGAFTGLKSLQTLKLESNLISVIYRNTFVGLDSVEYLHLSDNFISVIQPGGFNGLCLLKTLHLSKNNLTVLAVDVFCSLPGPFKFASNASYQVFLSGNPIQCNSDLCRLKKEEPPGNITWTNYTETPASPQCADDTNLNHWNGIGLGENTCQSESGVTHEPAESGLRNQSHKKENLETTAEQDDMLKFLVPSLSVVGSFIILGLLGYAFHRFIRPWCHNKEQPLLDFGFKGDVKLVLLLAQLDLAVEEQITKLWVNPKFLTCGSFCGYGNYGTVWSGTLAESVGTDEKEQQIAIKKIKGRNIDDSCVKDLMKEALTMARLNHVNILSVIGVSVHNDQPCILLPFMAKKDLRSYLTKHISMSSAELIKFTVDVARGMEYLKEQKLVHCDLASRNCLLDQDLTAKVSDFGSATEITDSNYYLVLLDKDKAKPFAVRWASLETLKEGVFTFKTEVWSYGVVLWEIFSYGAEPYQGLHNREIRGFLESGKRLPQPSAANDQMYKLMCRCWQKSPTKRPEFNDILIELEALRSEKDKEIKLSEDVSSS